MTKEILFLGALKNKRKDKSTGGLFIACSSLSSSLKENGIKIIELNTTYRSKSIGSQISSFKKSLILFLRCIKFVCLIISNPRAKTLFVFISGGNSYLDKIIPVLTAKFLGKKIVVFPRSGLLIKDYEKSFYNRIVTFVLSKADVVVCQSSFWKSFFTDKGVSPNKLVVIENWISEEKLSVSKTIQFKQKSNHEPLNIVFFSRIEKAKGIDDVLLASKHLKRIGFNHKFTVFGEGEYSAQLGKNISKSGLEEYVEFKGWLKSDKQLITLNNYHIGIFTSRFEGYPNSLLDFILAKVPVVAADIGSVNAVGGDLMSYYSPGNIEELGEVLMAADKNYSLLTAKAEKLYWEKFTNNNLASARDKVIKLIKESN